VPVSALQGTAVRNPVLATSKRTRLYCLTKG